MEETVTPRLGSRMWHLWHLAVGESYWEECALHETSTVQSALNPVVARRPPSMRLWVFQTSVWTAVGPEAGLTRVLVRSERVL